MKYTEDAIFAKYMVDKGLLSLSRKIKVLLHQQEKQEYLIEKIGIGHKEANYKRKINI